MSQTNDPAAPDLAVLLDRERLVARLGALVRTPSENPPGDEAEVARLVSSMCEEIGLETARHELEPGRPSVVARWGTGRPLLCYCSHYDVVPAGDPTLWQHHPYGAAIVNGVLHGRGSADAKGPMAAALEAVEILRAAGFRPAGSLQLALVADEETMGFKGAGFLVEDGIVKPDIAIVGEPTSLRVVRAQRGACWIRIITRGVAGHGSAPERGVNAVLHMAEIVLHLEETLPVISHDVLGGPSISVGTIRGGEKVNVIPASCIAEIDRRTVPGESVESVLQGLETAIARARERFPSLDARVELAFFGEPFEMPEGARVVREGVSAVAEVTRRDPDVVGFRGASDARFMAATGAEVILLGPGDIKLAHTAREHVDLAEVEHAAVAYALCFARLLSGGEWD